MNTAELLAVIKTTLQKSKVFDLARIADQGGFAVSDLIDLTFDQDEQIGFRAAWILENVLVNHEERFIPQLNYFLQHFPAQQNLSAMRHYCKILAMLTHKKASAAIQQKIADYPMEELVETVFGWLIDGQIPVAIKSHCLNILANLTTRYEWVKDELVQTMEFLVDKESVAFYGKVKQIRKQLKTRGGINHSE